MVVYFIDGEKSLTNYHIKLYLDSEYIDANHYDFSVIFTNFRPKLRCYGQQYLLRISDYCQPGTVLHLNIIVII
jgi:hypothetical protein